MKNEKHIVDTADYPTLKVLAKKYNAPLVEILGIALEQAMWIPEEIFRRELISPVDEFEDYQRALQSLRDVVRDQPVQDRGRLLITVLGEGLFEQGIDVDKGVAELMGW